MPGRLLREGETLAGAMKITLTPAAFGVTLIVSSVPAATDLSVNAVTAAGAGPGDAAVVLKTNGREKRGQGTLPDALSATRTQLPGAPVSRSSPGSCDATS